MPVFYTRLIYDYHIEASNPEAAKLELMDMLDEAMPSMTSIIETMEVKLPPPTLIVRKASEENEKIVYGHKLER